MYLSIIDTTNPAIIPMEGHILQEWTAGKYLIFIFVTEKNYLS